MNVFNWSGYEYATGQYLSLFDPFCAVLAWHNILLERAIYNKHSQPLLVLTRDWACLSEHVPETGEVPKGSLMDRNIAQINCDDESWGTTTSVLRELDEAVHNSSVDGLVSGVGVVFSANLLQLI
jgi:hypothetical protein